MKVMKVMKMKGHIYPRLDDILRGRREVSDEVFVRYMEDLVVRLRKAGEDGAADCLEAQLRNGKNAKERADASKVFLLIADC